MGQESTNICESLKIMEDIALQAEEGIRNKGSSSSSCLAQEHSFNNDKPKKNLNKINQELLDKYYRLKAEPLIARVIVIDEDDNKTTHYINRINYVQTPECISYNSPKGKFASRTVGDEVEIIINGQRKSFEILERIIFHTKYNGIWDSINTKVEQEDRENFITSLREFCEQQSQTIQQDASFDDFLTNLMNWLYLTELTRPKRIAGSATRRA